MDVKPDILAALRSLSAGVRPDLRDSDSVTDDATRRLLEQLETIACIADVHGTLQGDAAATADTADGPRAWGQLAILERVGSGSYGEVYRAWDPKLEREVALKLLNPAALVDEKTAFDEARGLARLRHPNVATVHGVDSVDGTVGIWMEFVDGRTLEAIVDEDGRLDAAETSRIGVEVARGLAAVHAAGLIHRDIKAQNVMRQPDGRVVLMDFGAGVHGGDSEELPALVGTPLCMAPEVLAGAPASPQSDIYMVGVLLFFLVTGQHPVAGRTLDELRKAHADRQTKWRRSRRTDVPRRLTRVIERAMAPQPYLRYATATDLANALVAVQKTPRRLLVVAAVAAILGTALVARTVDRALTSNGGRPFSLAAGMSARQVEWRFAWLFLGSPSPDGRQLSFTDAKTGNLAVLDLTSGVTTLLTTEASFSVGRYVTSSRFSADGRRIAYSLYQADRAADVRVLDTAGGMMRTLLHDDLAADAGVLAWSHDGTRVVVRIEPQDGPGRLEVIDVRSGNRRRIDIPTVKTVPGGAAFSPDDRFIVVDAAATPQTPRRLHVVDLSGGAAEPLLTGDDDDAEPFWVADRVLFSSSRMGKRGVWQVSVVNGRAAGPPTLVSDQLANGFWSVGLTDSGSFYYAAAEGTSSVYTADVAAGFEVGSPLLISGADAAAASPEWSPDGREVVWVARTRQGGGPRGTTLRFHDLASGGERTVTPPFVVGVNPRWSPDGKRLLIRGTDDKGGGVRMVDVETGRLLRSFLLGRPGDVAWHADGRQFFYMDGKARTIGRIDVATGVEHAFYALPPGQQFERGLAVSPGHDQIAFAVSQREETSIVTIPISGGSARTLLTVRGPHRIGIQQWTRDGQRVLFVRSRAIPGAPLSQEWQLWAVDRHGGEPQYLDFSMPNLYDVRPNRDGNALVFSSSNAENRLRVLEHVFSARTGQDSK